jgi:putative membrane protein
MKKLTWLLPASAFFILACNNEAKDSVEKADSANEAHIDSPGVTTQSTQSVVADEESAQFLVRAADREMAAVQLGELARDKATNQKVKDFGAMMMSDHQGASNEVRSLASQRNIILPDSVSDERKKDKDNLVKKSGAAFDKAYMRETVDNHNETIKLFENASGNVKDNAVKTFIDNTLPKLRSHLDSARSIQKALR